MRRRAKVVAWGVVAVVAGIGGGGCRADGEARKTPGPETGASSGTPNQQAASSPITLFAGVPADANVPVFDDAKKAPLYTPHFLVRPGRLTKCVEGGSSEAVQGVVPPPPTEGVDYWKCTGTRCDRITWTIGFDGSGCPVSAAPSVANCCTGDDPTACTAMDRKRFVVFAKGEYPYEVRFAPIGPPIKVASQDSGPHPINPEAPVARYKFTVYVTKGDCAPYDPNIIVTN